MLKIAWSDIYVHPLPENHRFPMLKYSLLKEQLLYEGTISQENLFEPEPLSEVIILLTHTSQYWEKLKTLRLSASEIRRIGFPLSAGLVEREIVIMDGTVKAADFALEYGIGMNIAGGTHHAFADKGEGFCLLNDIAIAANYLIKYRGIKKILVVDLDVHQGNGTATIFTGNPSVFTFSMHGENNFPMHKEASDLDLPLPDKIQDYAYLQALEDTLPYLIETVSPEFIFYQSGVDVLEGDKLGKLSLSIQGCKERDRIVLELCRKKKIPVAVSMGGGYSKRISDIVEAHANTFRLAQHLFF